MYNVMYRKMGSSWIVIDKDKKEVVCEIRGPVGVCATSSGILLHHGMYIHSFGFHRHMPKTTLLKFGLGESEEVLNQIVSDKLATKLLLVNPENLSMIMRACRN